MMRSFGIGLLVVLAVAVPGARAEPDDATKAAMFIVTSVTDNTTWAQVGLLPMMVTDNLDTGKSQRTIFRIKEYIPDD